MAGGILGIVYGVTLFAAIRVEVTSRVSLVCTSPQGTPKVRDKGEQM